MLTSKCKGITLIEEASLCVSVFACLLAYILSLSVYICVYVRIMQLCMRNTCAPTSEIIVRE